jgi:hypothetical protein
MTAAFVIADYCEMLAICNEKGMDCNIEIPALIGVLEKEQGIEPENINSPVHETQLSGFEKMAEYARRPA